MANPNWARWIHQSLAKYLKSIAVTHGVPVLVEGIDDRSSDFMEEGTRLEIRVNGPFSREVSKGYFELQVGVNVLLNSRMDGSTKNAFELDAILGIYHDAMDAVIAIYRLGTGPEDDQSHLGCLSTRSGKNGYIRVFRFGQMEGTNRLTQGMVDASYEMYLDE